jgi:hypothetical protein
MKKEKKELMFRSNTRITKKQDQFVKQYAKEHELTEGEVYRLIIQTFIRNTQ